MSITLHTIGFTQKSAERFFELLRKAGVKRIVDVRLNNTSQLAGYAKREDLAYFAKAVAGIDYVHLPELAPTPEMLAEYRGGGKDWERYAKDFLALIRERRIEETLPRTLLDGGCLLCSEHRPHHCHRSLVANYLCEKWGDTTVQHLE